MLFYGDLEVPYRYGYTFEGWTIVSGNGWIGGSLENGLTINGVTGDVTTKIRANWRSPQYSLTVQKGKGISSVTGGGSYVGGARVTVSATPAAGYTWLNWTGAGIGGSNNQTYTFTMPNTAVILVANATVNTYTITYDLSRRRGRRKSRNLYSRNRKLHVKNSNKSGI